MATAIIANTSNVLAKMSRPQIGIGRLPARRSTNDPKEVMNCKSCRKRKVDIEISVVCEVVTDKSKIKCNRVKPSCEACQVFNCACIYGEKRVVCIVGSVLIHTSDAVPKKRGPKTDVLEAVLKRVNGRDKR